MTKINSKIKYFDKPLMKKVFYKALPLIIGVISAGLINVIDNSMVGMMQPKGASQLAAVSLADKFIGILSIFIAAVISLFSFQTMQYAGKKEYGKVRDTIKLMFIFISVILAVAIILANVLDVQVMKFFQGKNIGDSSTKNLLANHYLLALVYKLIPISIGQVLIVGLLAFGKQKFFMYLTVASLPINALLNYILYKTVGLGLNGIAYSTIITESLLIVALLIIIYSSSIRSYILFNPFTIFSFDCSILILGFKRSAMALQVILWSSISIGVTIIYSRWFGDRANTPLGIVVPITRLFYSALDGVAGVKGYFVGRKIGSSDKKEALIIDKRINMYAISVAAIEGMLLVALAFAFPLLWTNVQSSDQLAASYMIVILGLTYPIAATSKTLLGSFKIAGMGKTIIISNGIFALLFEFSVPLILYIISQNTDLIHLEFWQLYLISRCLKLLKLPPTLYFWKKKKWLERAIA